MSDLRLKSRKTIPEATVVATEAALKLLMRCDPDYVRELVDYCRDESRVPWVAAHAKMRELELVRGDGGVRGDVREIVLAYADDEICLDLEPELEAKPCCRGDGSRCCCSGHATCSKC